MLARSRLDYIKQGSFETPEPLRKRGRSPLRRTDAAAVHFEPDRGATQSTPARDESPPRQPDQAESEASRIGW